MAKLNLIEEFRNDHRAVIDKLFALEAAIERRDVRTARSVIDELDRITGPHFKFEEEHLYPALKRLLGEKRVAELLGEHSGAVELVRNLRDLLSKPELSEAEAQSAKDSLSAFFVHASNCDGLNLLVERFSEEEKKALAEKLVAGRSEDLPLTSWKKA